MQAYFLKLPNDCLVPSSESDRELTSKIKTGEVVRLTLTRPRNVGLHRKYFALLNFAFDCWTPTIELGKHKLVPEKNFDRFRADLIILAGHYVPTYRIDGSLRIEAKSISFSNMTEDEFEDLYSKTIDVVLQHVCKNYTDDDLRKVIEQSLMDFT